MGWVIFPKKSCTVSEKASKSLYSKASFIFTTKLNTVLTHKQNIKYKTEQKTAPICWALSNLSKIYILNSNINVFVSNNLCLSKPNQRHTNPIKPTFVKYMFLIQAKYFTEQ